MQSLIVRILFIHHTHPFNHCLHRVQPLHVSRSTTMSTSFETLWSLFLRGRGNAAWLPLLAARPTKIPARSQQVHACWDLAGILLGLGYILQEAKPYQTDQKARVRVTGSGPNFVCLCAQQKKPRTQQGPRKNNKNPAYHRHNAATPRCALACHRAGGATGIVTTPFDVLKTRLMTQGASGRYTGVVHAATTISREEGLGAFMRGWQPRLLWISLGGFVFFPVLEAGKELFKPPPPSR
eukprot:363570-Chlamydomonas_euryale.AAC.9